MCSSDLNKKGLCAKLIEENIYIDYLNDDGESPLFIAIKNARLSITKILLTRSPNLDIQNKRGENIAFMVVMSKSIEIAKLFHIDDLIYSYNIFGNTLLHLAVNIESLEMVKYLLDLGHFVDPFDFYKRTPLFYALKQDNLEIINVLLKKGALLDYDEILDEYIYSPLTDKTIYLNEYYDDFAYNKYKKDYPYHFEVCISKSMKSSTANLIFNKSKKSTDCYGYTISNYIDMIQKYAINRKRAKKRARL